MENLLLILAAAAAFLAFVAWRLLERSREAEARAAQAELRLGSQGRSLGLVARELEAPGLGLLGLATRLPPEIAPGVESEGRRLLALADEVADQAAAQPHARSLKENRIPLGPLLKEAVETVALPMGAGARHWQVSPEAEALTVLADRRALGRVLSQALARAARETRAGDRITLRIVRAAETVALVIEDEGAGLPGGDLTGGEGTRGLSLGLSAARELMRAHGGELTLEAAPGIGARTWLTLPRARVLEDQLVG
ncbi:Histidine kinase-, DNA gyrase B-, and HSP90-like ATPase [Roseomonas rosea]|uniref:histidine kinase n=1 Tax=Muricoccus roseus TaxID=198092 RepID=A0A1M6AGC6_9PROT|nr:sensor histidine kinase [Roseomonas rosea]SHI35368.1 Histidine kinase-, DNA gyrase B-, and HSP90-like ATPase [Roseomonas rosea]